MRRWTTRFTHEVKVGGAQADIDHAVASTKAVDPDATSMKVDGVTIVFTSNPSAATTAMTAAVDPKVLKKP